MPAFFEYDQVLLGSQTTSGVGGSPINYRFTPSGTWSYSGSSTSFVLEEAFASNSTFNGDPNNEQIANNLQIGGSRAQTVNIGGTDRQVIWDYTFEVSSATETWRVAVIDVDLDNDDLIEAGPENGYFLIFPDGLPPADTNLTIGPIIENDRGTSHSGLGATVVCFAAGTLIETVSGSRDVQDLTAGDLVLTRDDGLQSLRWLGKTTVSAQGDLAPIMISKGVLGNQDDLVLSPQHAVLLTDWRAEFYFGEDEVLVRAVDLLELDGVARKEGGRVTYCHILFDNHQLVSASGIWSESLYLGEMSRLTMNHDALAEIEALFPRLTEYGPMAAPCLRGFEARFIAA